MSCTPLPKAATPVWAKQLTRLCCLVVYAKFQFVYTTNGLGLKSINNLQMCSCVHMTIKLFLYVDHEQQGHSALVNSFGMNANKIRIFNMRKSTLAIVRVQGWSGCVQLCGFLKTVAFRSQISFK